MIEEDPPPGVSRMGRDLRRHDVAAAHVLHHAGLPFGTQRGQEIPDHGRIDHAAHGLYDRAECHSRRQLRSELLHSKTENDGGSNQERGGQGRSEDGRSRRRGTPRHERTRGTPISLGGALVFAPGRAEPSPEAVAAVAQLALKLAGKPTRSKSAATPGAVPSRPTPASRTNTPSPTPARGPLQPAGRTGNLPRTDADRLQR